MPDLSQVRVGVVYWQPNDGTATRIYQSLERLGYSAISLSPDAEIPDSLHVLVIWGPLGSPYPLANQLLSRPLSGRPKLVLLMTEQLPNPALPEWLRYWLGLIRAWAERLAYVQQADGLWQLNPRLPGLTNKAYRFRYYGDLYWLQRQGLLSLLAVTSQVTADFLRQRGFDPIVPGLSYDSALEGNFELERDIPVLWLGKIATNRRRRLLNRLRSELRVRGVEIFVVDGKEHPFVFGEERTVLLNRTKIMLNLMRTKWDDNSMRFTLAAHSRAFIVTEPVLPHTPYQPGVHLAEASIDRMADRIFYFLNHEDERQQYVDRAYNLIKQYPFDQGVAHMLEKALSS